MSFILKKWLGIMHCIWLLDLYSSPVFPWITQSWHFRRLLDNYFAECLVVLLFHDSGCVALEGVSQKWWRVFPLHPSRGHRDLILLSLRKFAWIPCLWRICQTCTARLSFVIDILQEGSLKLCKFSVPHQSLTLFTVDSWIPIFLYGLY